MLGCDFSPRNKKRDKLYCRYLKNGQNFTNF
jgi:hypothetical protein